MQISNRLQEFAARSLHLIAWSDAKDGLEWGETTLNISEQEVKCRYLWRSQGDKELLSLALNNDISQLERGYFEAFGELASNLSWTKFNLLGAREIENYLRDNNAALSHEAVVDSTPGLWIESLRSQLLEAWLRCRLLSHLSPYKGSINGLELTKWLEQINSDNIWGKRSKPIYDQCQIVAVIPPDISTGPWEIQWRFPVDIESYEASAFCSSLQSVLLSHSVAVKVVAES